MYRLLPPNLVMRNGVQVIPQDPDNADYVEYLLWLAEGNVPEPADAVVPLIPPITPRQIRMALTRVGLRAVVEAAVVAGDQDLKDWYEFSTMFERTHPQVVAMGTALEQTDTELDLLWALGASL